MGRKAVKGGEILEQRGIRDDQATKIIKRLMTYVELL